MEFGWINLFHFIVVVSIIIPNIVFAKVCDYSNEGIPKAIILLENIGRYGAMLLMIVPVFVDEFGYGSVVEMLIDLCVSVVLFFAYVVVWILFAKKKSYRKAITLAVLPVLIFLVAGITLRHWALVAVSVIFAIGHIYITHSNAK